MTVDERETYELRLKEEPSFAAQVDKVRAVVYGIEAATLKNDLDSFHEEMVDPINTKSENPKVKSLFFQKYAMAASVVLLIGLATFWFLAGQNTNEQLFEKHFKPDPGLATTMSDDQAYNFYEGMVSYKHGDYKIAIELPSWNCWW